MITIYGLMWLIGWSTFAGFVVGLTFSIFLFSLKF